jgi:membrane protein
MLQNTQSGLIAGFGIVLLLWSVIKLLDSVEEIFNEIWEIKKGRTLLRKLTDYITVMIISPVLMILAGGIILSIENHIGNIHLLSVLNIILIKLFAYCLIMAVFTCLYLVMPNTKVNLKSAAIAGLIASIMFQILEWAYVKFQIGANSLNVIYGGFAALPLFLILIQYSWYVVLFGAEIAFANEHVDQYELKNEINKLSPRYKKIISLMIANVVSKRFYNGEKPLSDIEISEQLDIPYRLARMIINDFTETGIFNEIKSENTKEIRYQPGVTESKFTVNYIIETIDKKGTNTLPISDTNELIHINKLVEDMDKIFHNNIGNTLVHNLVK